MISAVINGAKVALKEKRDLPHERQLTLSLGDGRDLVINLDQGFGAWQVVGRPRHRFDSNASDQASSLMNLGARVEIREGQNGTVIVRKIVESGEDLQP